MERANMQDERMRSLERRKRRRQMSTGSTSGNVHKMAQQSTPRYKSEVFVPIQKDSKTFEERQKNIWEDMQERMERRRREWEDEVEKMRSDFFKLKPNETRRGSSENLLESRPLNDIFYDDTGTGNKKFCVSFEVSEFRPEEISVRTQEHKLIVHAKHEEKGDGRSLSREFSRTVDIPKHVDPDRLSCCLSNDGVLQIEAPVPAPQYSRIEDALRRSGAVPQTRAGPVVQQQDGSKKFRIVVDIGTDYLPQDVSVKTIDKKLVLQAKHEEKSQGRSSSKSLSREFDLPESVEPNSVTASMTGDGKLILEAPIANYAHGSYTGRPGATKKPTVTISVGK